MKSEQDFVNFLEKLKSYDKNIIKGIGDDCSIISFNSKKKSSKKGFSVDIGQIPTRPKFDKFITSKYKEECILGGGEDYELCFTANNKYSNKISSISNKLKLNITKIGRITNNGYEYLSGDKVINIKSEGYDHFKK